VDSLPSYLTLAFPAIPQAGIRCEATGIAVRDVTKVVECRLTSCWFWPMSSCVLARPDVSCDFGALGDVPRGLVGLGVVEKHARARACLIIACQAHFSWGMAIYTCKASYMGIRGG
jgi:hypothetical protein